MTPHCPRTNQLGVVQSAAILVCVLGASVAAQDAKKPPPTEFNGDIGLVSVTGNTSVSTFSMNEKFIRRIEQWEFKQDLGSVYGKTDGAESSNLLRAGVRADYTLAEHFALYALTAYDRNKFAGIKERFAEGLGGVAKIIADDVNQLNVEAGYQLTQQRNLIGPDDNFSALRLASTWKHSFTKTSYFSEGLEYLPNLENHDDYRMNSETAVVAPLSTHIGMKFSYVVRFANDPPLNAAGTEQLRKMDRILSAGIQVTY
jgi:putative salt-induced outer membrane protein